MVGRNAYTISYTGIIANVNPFTPDYDSMHISIVDATVWYDLPYNGQAYIFMLRNALFFPYIKNNPIPHYLMIDARIRLNNTPKIQTSEPTEENRSKYFPETDF